MTLTRYRAIDHLRSLPRRGQLHKDAKEQAQAQEMGRRQNGVTPYLDDWMRFFSVRQES